MQRRKQIRERGKILTVHTHWCTLNCHLVVEYSNLISIQGMCTTAIYMCVLTSYMYFPVVRLIIDIITATCRAQRDALKWSVGSS